MAKKVKQDIKEERTILIISKDDFIKHLKQQIDQGKKLLMREIIFLLGEISLENSMIKNSLKLLTKNILNGLILQMSS